MVSTIKSFAVENNVEDDVAFQHVFYPELNRQGVHYNDDSEDEAPNYVRDLVVKQNHL